jgi:DeoR/GlpR family transcriptional regulator of sugar metabolism
VLAAQRREVILEHVRRRGAARVSDLTAELGVSDMTIRRDLDTLAKAGLVAKVHGGATAASSTLEPGFEAKSARDRAAKEAIAAEAVRLVPEGAAVGLSAGTTTWVLAHALRTVPRLTVVTNSVEAADVLDGGTRTDQTVVLTGGVRTLSGALVGPLAVHALTTFNLDLVFMGVHGMDARAGFTTPNVLEAEVNRALIAAGRRLVVVADATKWGMVGVSTFASLDEADVLVTDDRMGRSARSALSERVGELLVGRPGAVPGIEGA